MGIIYYGDKLLKLVKAKKTYNIYYIGHEG